MNEFLKLHKQGEYIKYNKSTPVFAGNSFLPQRAFVPISHDLQVAPIPVVSRGEYVREGQVIAKSYNENSANIHAPIPGVVGEFYKFEGKNGKPMLSIPIKLEGVFNLLGKRPPNYPWKNTLPSEIINIIENRGLLNTAYNNIPLATYLRRKRNTTNNSLYICLFDNDPSCGLENFLVENFLDNVIEGIAIIARALDVNKIIIFHKFKNKKAQELNSKTNDMLNDKNCKHFFVKDIYLSHKKNKAYLNSSFLINPSTAMHTYEALINDRPFISNYVLLGGKALKNEKVFKVRLGTPIGNLLEECGGLTFQPDYIIINGLINGYAINNFDLPIDKTIKSIHAISNNFFKNYETRDCENCGKCITVCPYNLNPIEIVKRISRNEYTADILRQIEICEGCSSCSCVCSARIPLSSIITKTKKELSK